MTAAQVKGWCPGAHRPMMSGDGLVVRVRPRLARLDAAQVLGLCALARRFGNGTIDLTSRANLQLRGVDARDHEAVLRGLAELDLLDAEPGLESRRNILVAPLYAPGDLTARLASALMARLEALPELPAKFGFAMDAGPAPVLRDASADIRIEAGRDGLILRADGAKSGVLVEERAAIDRAIALARWFAQTRAPETRRMAAHLAAEPLPEDWQGAAPGADGDALAPGPSPLGPVYGAPFGHLPADALADLMRRSGAAALRVTPWRLFLLEGGRGIESDSFVTAPGDALLRADACPGAPFCPQASVDTRTLARALAPRVSGRLHVSGCAKGCARRAPAQVTLVGRNGRFDLVKSGRAGDQPCETGLSAQELMTRTDLT